MIIVLEGVDLAGKSTLARTLAEMTGLDVLHRGPPARHPLYEYETTGRWTGICDRWHLGETIYGPILRGESKLDEAGLWHTSAYLRARGALVVLLQPTLETVLRRFDERGDDLIKREQLARIHAAYNDYIGSHYRDMVVQSDTPTDYVTYVRDCALTKWLEAEPLRESYALRTYVGPLHPQVLLIGDKRHHGEESDFDSAFVPMSGNSGHFLLQAVASCNMRHEGLHEIGIMNANECPGDHLYEAWRTLGRPRTVALGANAHNKLAHLRIPHGAAPHPQYCRRFHHGAQAEYGVAVMEALYTQADLRNWRPA